MGWLRGGKETRGGKERGCGMRGNGRTAWCSVEWQSWWMKRNARRNHQSMKRDEKKENKKMCRYDDVHGKWYKRNAREEERGDALLQSFSTFGCRGDDAYWHYGCVPTLTSTNWDQICFADDVWESILICHHERLFHYCSWWCCFKLRSWRTHPRCDEHLVHTHTLSLSLSLTNSLTIFIPHSLTHSLSTHHPLNRPPTWKDDASSGDVDSVCTISTRPNDVKQLS